MSLIHSIKIMEVTDQNVFKEIVLNVVEYPKGILEQIREYINEEIF